MEQWDIVEGDLFVVLPTLGPADVVITDPPWNLGKPYGRHDDAMPRGAYLRWLGDALSLARASSRRGAVCFLDRWHLRHLDQLGQPVAGVLPWRREPGGWEPIVWFHDRPGDLDPPGIARAVAALASPHLDPGGGCGHPCPKPVSAVAPLVELFASPGGSVVDPIAGSGTTVVAAAALGRRATGVELEPRFVRLARARCLAALSRPSAAASRP